MTETIREKLFAMQDAAYKDFSSKLMPTVDADSVIGVRTPLLRKLAKELKGEDSIDEFLQSLPHAYFEENNLHAFIICETPDYDTCIAQIEGFLPYVDNWATCDSMRPRSFAKNKDRLICDIKLWIKS